MAITAVASARAVFSASGKTLSMATPAAARKGDVFLALASHHQSDGRGATPAGWTALDTNLGALDRLDVLARMVDDNEPDVVAIPLATVTNEWLGELVVLRGTYVAAVRESLDSASFSTTTSLATAGAVSQQAINLVLTCWLCAGSPVLTVPAGYQAIDAFSSAIVSSRAMLVGYRLAGGTGLLAFPPAAASSSTTGISLSFVLRDRAPIAPAALVDLVPGNIGLIGRDTRPAR